MNMENSKIFWGHDRDLSQQEIERIAQNKANVEAAANAEASTSASAAPIIDSVIASVNDIDAIDELYSLLNGETLTSIRKRRIVRYADIVSDLNTKFLSKELKDKLWAWRKKNT